MLEASPADQRRLDGLFGVYEKLILIFGEAHLPAWQRETVDRLLRLAPKLSPIREAQAWKEQARYLELNGTAGESVAAGERAAAILRPLADPAAAAQLTGTLVGLGRGTPRRRFPGGGVGFDGGDRPGAARLGVGPAPCQGVRRFYWAHIVFGDALASPMAFNLGRTAEGVEHYEKARRIAEGLVQADPANEAARVDLARALASC